MATATAMYHSGKNPLKRITRASEEVVIPKGTKVRRLHKAFLRYHDPENWPILREALKRMGRADLIGNGRQHLIPAYQPIAARSPGAGPRRPAALPFRTQHTGLPKSGSARKPGGRRSKAAAAESLRVPRTDPAAGAAYSDRLQTRRKYSACFCACYAACRAIKVPGCLAVSRRNSST